MSTDNDVTVSHTADKHLQEIDKKYPGFIHMKSQLGIKYSYQLQKILQSHKKSNNVIRGFRLVHFTEMLFITYVEKLRFLFKIWCHTDK